MAIVQTAVDPRLDPSVLYYGTEPVGLGAYPTDSYFDPNRPSWLPYWIDTPTESNRKYNAENIMQATVNAAGMAAGTVAGGVINTIGGAAGAAAGGVANQLNLSGLLLLGGAGFLAYKYLTRV
jgi:hypothetical protein